MNTPPEPTDKLPATKSELTLGEFVAATGLFSIVGIALSLGYEVAFASSIGLSLSTLPFSVQDLTRSSSFWFSGFGAILIGGTIFFILNAAGTRGVSDNDYVAKSKSPKIAKFLVNAPYQMAVWTIGGWSSLVLVTSFMGVPASSTVQWQALSMFWLSIGSRLMFSKGVQRYFGPKARIWIFGSVLCVLFVIERGHEDASEAMKREFNDTVFIGEHEFKCSVIRTYSSFYIVRYPEHITLDIIPEREVRSMRQMPNKDATRPITFMDVTGLRWYLDAVYGQHK